MQIRLYESTETTNRFHSGHQNLRLMRRVRASMSSATDKFMMEKRFAELEKFRFADPIGNANMFSPRRTKSERFPVYSSARYGRENQQQESIGCGAGNKQAELSKSRGIVRQRLPQTSSPRAIAKLIVQAFCRIYGFGHSAGSGIKHGAKEDERLLIRTDAYSRRCTKSASKGAMPRLSHMLPPT